MKSKSIVFLTIMMLASIGSISSAYAQSDEMERANVPFDFYADGQKMPAGTYTIGINLETDMITLKDASGKHQMFQAGTHEGYGEDKSELVFEHSGNTYGLIEVKSDVIDLTFRPRVPEQGMATRVALPPVEVALNR
jgi:hypothetical protein